MGSLLLVYGTNVITDGTLRQYMSEAMAKGVVHDAGRGWYSSIPEPFNLEMPPIKTTIRRIQKAFPLLEFSCWSTQHRRESSDILGGNGLTNGTKP